MELPVLERAGSPLVAQPDELPPTQRDEDARQDLLLEGALAPVEAAISILMKHSKAKSLQEAVELLEAWSPAEAAKHPRWPKGSPLAGKFMRRGQRFELDGVMYDVDFGVPGGVYAHVATLGDISKAKHVFIPATKLEKDTGHTVVGGVVRPPAQAHHYENYAHNATHKLKATVIDPYVVADHDASIPVPADAPATLTAARWQRFGRADQLRYVDLMHQFGAWKDTGAQQKVDAELAKQPQEMVDFLKSAYSSQFGSSSGMTIGLLQVFSKWFGGLKKPSQAELEKDRDRFETLKQVQDAAARVIQWDLYNRLAAPDVTVFHKSGDSPATWKAKWLGKEPIFSGLSQTQRYTPGGFGPTGVATPLAIRNVVMATTSADVYKGHGFGGEQEVSVGEPMRYDARSYVFADNQLDGAEKAALTNLTQAGTDGSTVDLIRNRLEHGDEFPEIPISPNIQMQSAQQWIAPPPAATVGAGKLDYAEKDKDGVPVAHPAKDLELKPGDYIEGMKGTRYIVISNPSSEYGVSYYKVTDSGTPTGPKTPYTLGPIHDQATGNQAYAGHQDWAGGEEQYNFQFELPFKKLAGHYDLPTQKAGVTEFVAAAWSQSADAAKLKDLPVGGKFYVNGVPYEKTGAVAGSKVAIKSLLSGENGTAEAAYKSHFLKLKEGYTEQGVPAFDPGEHFVSKPATLAELALKKGDLFLAGQSGTTMAWQVTDAGLAGDVHVTGVGSANQGKLNTLAGGLLGRKLTPKPEGWTSPQVGDTLAVGGKKGEVTKILKGGVVQVNTHPGVHKVAPDDPILAGLFSAGAHTVGPKMKVRDMQVGTKFHGGTGGKAKPYVVVAKGEKVAGKPGAFALVRSLETGEETHVSHQKAFAVLLTAHQTAPTPAAKPGTDALAEMYNPAAWVEGPEKPTTELHVGEKFSSPVYGQCEVTADKGAAWEAKSLTSGAMFPVLKSQVAVATLEPNNVMPAVAFDPAAYVEGPPTKLGDLVAGDIFKGTAKGKHYLVTKTGAKSGLSAVDLQTGNKSGPWTYEKVAPKMEPKPLGGGPGGATLLSHLAPGDQFSINGQVHQLVEKPAHGEDNATVAAVLPGGGLGFPGKVGWTPTLLVSFHQDAAAAKAEAAKLAPAKAALSGTDNVLLHTGVQSYSPKSKSGGGYHFMLAKHAPEGALLEDKAGQQFLVKKAGADPVVSDGTTHWLIGGEHNLKQVAPGQAALFVDNAGPASQSGQPQKVSAFAGIPPLTQNYPGGKGLAELGLGAGDYFVDNGTPYKVTGKPNPVWWEAENLETHGTETFGHNFAPTSWAKADALASQPAGVPAAQGTSWDAKSLAGFTKNTAVAKAGDLPVGTVFASVMAVPGQQNNAWKVAGPAVEGSVPVEIVALASPQTNLLGHMTSVSATFVPGWIGPVDLPAPPAPVAAAKPTGGFIDNSLVKLTASQLAPGTFYKAVSGTGWLLHGPDPGDAGHVLAEVVDDAGGGPTATLGSVHSIPGTFVPAEVGEEASLAKEDFEKGDKVLLSQVEPGDVYSAQPDVAVAKVLQKQPGALTIVGSQPDGKQSAPYVVPIAPGIQVWRMKPTAGAQKVAQPTAANALPAGAPAPSPSPGAYGETDAYLVQGLVDAWHAKDEGAYFDAESEVMNRMAALSGEGVDAYVSDPDAVDHYVGEVIAKFQIKAPGGGEPFDGEGMGAPTAEPAMVSAGELSMGDHVYSAAHDAATDPAIEKPAIWKVTGAQAGVTEFEMVVPPVMKAGIVPVIQPGEPPVKQVFGNATMWVKAPQVPREELGPGSKVKSALTLPIGVHIQAPPVGEMTEGPVWELTGFSGEAANLKLVKQSTLEGGEQYGTLPLGTETSVPVDSVANWRILSMPGQATAASEQPVPLSSLKQGDKFHAENVHGVAAGEFVVTGPNVKGNLPEGVDPADAVWAANMETGKLEWFGSGLPVQKLASGGSAVKATLPPGYYKTGFEGTLGDMAPGTLVQLASGGVFEVVGHKPDVGPDGMTTVESVKSKGKIDASSSSAAVEVDHSPTVAAATVDVEPGDKLTNLSSGGDLTVAKVAPGIDGGKWLTFEGKPAPTQMPGHFHLNPGEEEQVGLVKAGLPEVPAIPFYQAPSSWKPFSPKSKTGGGYAFGDLGSLKPGTHFTDKTGVHYVKAITEPGHEGSAFIALDDAPDKGVLKGAKFYADPKARVKLLPA